MSRVDKAELDDKYKRDLLNKMLYSAKSRIDELNGINYQCIKENRYYDDYG